MSKLNRTMYLIQQSLQSSVVNANLRKSSLADNPISVEADFRERRWSDSDEMTMTAYPKTGDTSDGLSKNWRRVRSK